MIRISDNVRAFIIDNFDSSSEILKSQSANDILMLIYNLIDDSGFISQNDGLNSLGSKAQKIYDELYRDNLNPALSESVTLDDVKTALASPISILLTKKQKSTGESSQTFIGKNCLASINPDTGVLFQMCPRIEE